MKAKILDINGKEKNSIDLPKIFEKEIREDIVAKVLETIKEKQPYAPSLMAGKQHSAKGKIVHRRHVWRSGYGRGQSRVPRKIFSQRGSQFNWEAAEVPSARGGMRAHPPKVISMLKHKKINKKEMKIAFNSLLRSTIDKQKILERYSSIKEKDLKEIPIIVESKISELKTKELLKVLKNILGKKLLKVAIKNKSIRSGIGKMRGRKYKSNAGALLILGKDEKIKTNLIDIAYANSLKIKELSKGGLGRLTIYTENAIKEIGERK